MGTPRTGGISGVCVCGACVCSVGGTLVACGLRARAARAAYGRLAVVTRCDTRVQYPGRQRCCNDSQSVVHSGGVRVVSLWISVGVCVQRVGCVCVRSVCSTAGGQRVCVVKR